MHACCKETRETCACQHCHLGPCSRCGEDNLGALYDGMCAGCKRDTTSRERETLCDICSTPGAFRNPSTRKNEYLCSGCHLDRGDSIQSPVPLSALARPDCIGKDIEDPAHVWVHIRGTRFQCRCGTKRYSAKLRDIMRRT